MGYNYKKGISLEEYFREVIGRLEKGNRFSTARNYAKTIESFKNFIGEGNFPVSDLTADIMAEYNAYLSQRHVTRNTQSFYNRILRAVYNRAVKEGYVTICAPSPFEKVYTGVDRTRKRSLTKKELRRIVDMDLGYNQEMELSRDLFLFSFYARGMCFVDMAYLTWKDVEQGCIVYVRSKTDQQLQVQIEPCMTAIMDKWKKHSSLNYVFPILRTDNPKEAFEEYEYRLCRHNLMLKEIGRRASTPFPLNSYAARHSWATLARDSGIPLSVISGGMGHTSERTTRIYLSQLEHGVIDRANRLIIAQVAK